MTAHKIVTLHAGIAASLAVEVIATVVRRIPFAVVDVDSAGGFVLAVDVDDAPPAADVELDTPGAHSDVDPCPAGLASCAADHDAAEPPAVPNWYSGPRAEPAPALTPGGKRRTPAECKWCGRPFPSRNALAGHRPHCKSKPADSPPPPVADAPPAADSEPPPATTVPKCSDCGMPAGRPHDPCCPHRPPIERRPFDPDAARRAAAGAQFAAGDP